LSYGGYHPYPRRFGGGRPRLRIIHDALNAARGTAIDASNPATIAWVENMAYARAICFDGYGTNDRLALQWDPDRMTDMLPRWEAIFKIVVPPTATAHDRRQVVRKRFRRFLEASALHSRLVARLEAELGAVFVGVEYIPIASAVIISPSVAYPWGSVVAGLPWLSTVAHILVLLRKPEGYSAADFYAAAAKIVPATDGLLPAWATIDWYRAPTAGVVTAIAGGPSQAGFYLDAEANLDNNIFDDALVGDGGGPPEPDPEPALVSLNFATVYADGGDSVTITGTDLASASACTWGGASCAITANTATSLTFTTPVKVTGTYDVVVTTAAGTSNALSLESFAPVDLTPTILMRAPFSASPWVSEDADARNGVEATNPPTPGTSVNGKVPAHYDGSNDVLNPTSAGAGETLADIYGAGDYYGVALVKLTSIQTDSATESNNDAILATASSGYHAVYMRQHSGGLAHVYHYDSAVAVIDASAPIVADGVTWQFVHWRFRSATPDLTIGIGGTWGTPTASAANRWAAGDSQLLRVGRSTNDNATMNGDMLEFAVFPDLVSDANLTKWRTCASCRYGISV
jgi:hypothetical protein